VKFSSFSYVVNCVLDHTIHHLSVLLRHTYTNSPNAFLHAEGRHSYNIFMLWFLSSIYLFFLA